MANKYVFVWTIPAIYPKARSMFDKLFDLGGVERVSHQTTTGMVELGDDFDSAYLAHQGLMRLYQNNVREYNEENPDSQIRVSAMKSLRLTVFKYSESYTK